MENIQREFFERYLKPEYLLIMMHIVVIVIAGVLIIRMIDVLMRKFLSRKASEQSRVIIHKGIVYLGWAVISLAILSELGLKLSAVLGAAGVVGIAVGIASQKSLGNIISGFFLVSDKTFEVGDVIKVGTTTGIVHGLDLLSVKLRTFDNTFIRIPNDQIITTEITNITRFPIRRLDFHLQVAYKDDLEVVKKTLLSIARENPLCLDEPEPFYLYKDFGSSGIEILFAVWFEKSNLVEVKNSVFEAVKNRFAEEGIEIPFQHITVYSGNASKPFDVEIQEKTSRET